MHIQLKVLSEKNSNDLYIVAVQHCIVQITLTLNGRECTYSVGIVNVFDADSLF